MFFFSPNVSSSFHLNEHNSCAKHFRKFFSLLSGSLRANFKRLYITNIMSNITTYIKITGNKLKYQLNSSVSHPQSCNHSLLRNHAVKFKFAGPPYVIITAYLPSMLKSSMHVHSTGMNEKLYHHILPYFLLHCHCHRLLLHFLNFFQ